MKKNWLIATSVVIVIAVALYFALSKPKTTITPQAGQNSQMAPEHVEMLKALAARLEQNPNDGKGWAMLARSYAVLGRYQEALPAYEKAAALIPTDPILLVDYADVLGAMNGKNLQGKPVEILQSALKLDPNNSKGLNLMGTAAFQSGDYAHAIAYWEKVLPLLPPDSPNAKKIIANVADARNRMSGKQPSADQGKISSAANSSQISGIVKLSPALAGKVSPTDTVFVFAKALSGPPMPIAVIRAQVKDLPQKFTLNDSMAMMPSMKLSSFHEVAIGVKVSKSGTASPQRGDLRGEVAPVKIGANNVQLIIDQVVQ